MKQFVYFAFISLILYGVNVLHAQTQFDNAGFEEWEEIGYGPSIIEPVNWSSVKSTDDNTLNGVAPVVWGRSDIAHSGNYSLYLFSRSIFGFVATGIITNGRVHADMNPDLAYTYTDPEHEAWHTRISARPDSITGWYMANPMPGDFAKIKIVLHRGYIEISESADTSGFIGSTNLNLSGNIVDVWTRFSAPINYYLDDEPEFVLATISSSKGVDALDGTELWLDDLEFIYNNGTGTADENPENLALFSANNQLHVYVASDKTVGYTLSIYSISGSLQMKTNGFTNQKNSHKYKLKPGTYVVHINYGHKALTKKIIL